MCLTQHTALTAAQQTRITRMLSLYLVVVVAGSDLDLGERAISTDATRHVLL